MKKLKISDKILQSENLSLVLENVSFSYGKRKILHDINFSLKINDFTALCGKNGSGKSTLLEIIACLNEKILKSSKIFLHFQNEKIPLYKLDFKERAKIISFMPQNETPAWNFEVFDFILSGRFAQKSSFYTEKDFEKVLEITESLKISNLLEKNIFELSGGEFQKIRLARTLVQDAKFIILDEPLNFLDISFEKEFMMLLKDFSQKNKKGVLFSSHNLNSASYFAEKAVLISEFQQNENRQIFLEGKCSEIFTSEILSSVYGGKISVFYHPISGKPIIE